MRFTTFNRATLHNASIDMIDLDFLLSVATIKDSYVNAGGTTVTTIDFLPKYKGVVECFCKQRNIPCVF